MTKLGAHNECAKAEGEYNFVYFCSCLLFSFIDGGHITHTFPQTIIFEILKKNIIFFEM